MPKDRLIKLDVNEFNLTISAFGSDASLLVEIHRNKDSLEQIERLSEMYRTLIALRSFSEESDSRTLLLAERLGEQLYALFFEGLEDVLEGCSTLFIEHTLFKFPLELAFNGKEFIGQKYSVGNWIKGFGKQRKRETKEVISDLQHKTLKALFLGDIANEGEDLNKLFSWRAKGSLCETLTSTWSDVLLKKLNTDRYSVLHFTCHGSFNEADPDQSFLILDQGRSGESEAAILRSRQLKRLNLSYTPLVFLNACHSGKVQKNYLGFVGFADNLLQSGVATFITTLWSVSDQSALHFAKAFYEHFLRGETVGSALQQARLRCWHDKQDTLTSLAYVLFGDPNLRMSIDSEKQDLDTRTDLLPPSE